MSELAAIMRGVTKAFRTASGPPVEVLRGADLEVRPGESLAITGPSGSGKTTLLHLLGGLDGPDDGFVEVAGQDLGRLDEPGLTRLRGRTVGFVFQSSHLLPQLTVLENVLVPAWAAGEVAARAKEAGDLLDRLGLGARLRHRPGQLSGGERQRAALARALVLRPALLLADEPTGSLDRAGAAGLGDLLVELNRSDRITMVVVTHDQDLAGRLGRRLRLRDGVLRE